MLFAIGDKVVHPKHGAGLIRRIAHMDLTEGPQQYYVIEIPSQRATLFVPQREAEAGAIRRVASESRLQLALETLRSPPRPLPDEAAEREASLLAKLSTGRPLLIAEVLRDLAGYGQRRRLTLLDRRLLRQAVDTVAAEVALVQDADPAEVAQTLEPATGRAFPRALG